MQQALDIFPKELVLEAVKRRFGNPFSLQEICDDILALKQKAEIEKYVFYYFFYNTAKIFHVKTLVMFIYFIITSCKVLFMTSINE